MITVNDIQISILSPQRRTEKRMKMGITSSDPYPHADLHLANLVVQAEMYVDIHEKVKHREAVEKHIQGNLEAAIIRKVYGELRDELQYLNRFCRRNFCYAGPHETAELNKRFNKLIDMTNGVNTVIPSENRDKQD